MVYLKVCMNVHNMKKNRKLILNIVFGWGQVAAPLLKTVLSLYYSFTVCSAYLTRKKLLKGKQRIHSVQKSRFIHALLNYELTELYWNMQYYKCPHCKFVINIVYKFWLLNNILTWKCSETYCILKCSNTNVSWVTNICSEHFCSQHCFFHKHKSKENVNL